MFKAAIIFLILFQSKTWAEGLPGTPFLLVPHRWENKALIFVDKKIRKLFVYRVKDGTPVSIFETEADFGKAAGIKTRRDDHKTPEGIYFPQTHLTPPNIPFALYGNRAFPLDYPNFFDRTDGKTGSGIWIHSVPDNVPLTRGSRGCVVVRNKSIDELKKLITLKDTPVIIQSEANPDIADKEEVKTFLENWKIAWASKDLEKYITFYSDAFKAQGYNRNSWKDYKSRINSVAGEISVIMEDPSAIKAHNQYMVSFVQKYKSDKLQDSGIKTLWVRKEDSNFRIIREEWTAISPDALLGFTDADATTLPPEAPEAPTAQEARAITNEK